MYKLIKKEIYQKQNKRNMFAYCYETCEGICFLQYMNFSINIIILSSLDNDWLSNIKPN